MRQLEFELPQRYPEYMQQFHPNYQNPFPMGYELPPNPNYSVNVWYNGVPMYQTLNNAIGPILVPRARTPRDHWIWGTPYPVNHSVPTPYQMRFIPFAGARRL